MSENGSESGLRRRVLSCRCGDGVRRRRTALINHAAVARAAKVPVARGGKFPHGVSSGFLTHKAITLWTRVSELERTSKVTLEIARDKHFKKIVKSKEVAPEEPGLHRPRTDQRPEAAQGVLLPLRDQEQEVRVGKFRTMPPPDSKMPIKIAYMSCQDYEAGYYNAHAALAKEDLDLVLFLGDYMYEHRYYPGPDDRLDTLGANGDGDVQTLDEYRSKYHQAQADPDLQAPRRRTPSSTSGTTTRSRTTTRAASPTRPPPIPRTSRTTTRPASGPLSRAAEERLQGVL